MGMHRFFSVVYLLLPFMLSAQISTPGSSPDFNKRNAPCFQRTLDRLAEKYPVWECGHNTGIVDCNEKLEFDPGSNTVYSKTSGQPFTGDCEMCFRNGIRQRVVHYVDGKSDGIDTTYYRSGCPQVIRNNIQGKENGTWTYYFDTSGIVAWQINYANGLKNGLSIFYKQHQVGNATTSVVIDHVKHIVPYPVYESDTFKIEHYANGLLNGVKKEFWPGSRLKREVGYKNGVFDGAFITYDTTGTILQEIHYKEGKKVGESKMYYNNGHIMKTGVWKNGLKNGEFKEFYPAGGIQTVGHYRNGLRDGVFIRRDLDNRIRRQARYEKDQLVEEHVFDKQGNEIRTVGEEKSTSKAEDDKLPGADDSKKGKDKNKDKD